jgi:hypothetical protein
MGPTKHRALRFQSFDRHGANVGGRVRILAAWYIPGLGYTEPVRGGEALELLLQKPLQKV